MELQNCESKMLLNSEGNTSEDEYIDYEYFED